MGFRKSSYKREVYNNKILSQETNKKTLKNKKKILFLSIIFAILTIMCIDVVLFGLVVFETAFLTREVAFPRLEKFLSYYALKYGLCPLFVFFSFLGPL